jgi:hypothetical protein
MMKGMRKIVRGFSFKDLLSYCENRDSPDAEKGKLIGGNMAGQNIDVLTLEFVRARDQRPDIEKPVWHNALRLPAGEKISNEKFAEIASDYMQSMGFTDSHPYAVYLHDDAEGQHVHIVASRISYDGKVYLGKNENLKSTQVISKLEQRHGLTITPGVELDDQGKLKMPEVKTPSKSEVEQALRKNEKPARSQLQSLVQEAMSGKPTMTDFLERLEVAGVRVIPNIAKSTKKVNGLSFELNNVSFKASDLGDRFKWSRLTQEVNYVETRDFAQLARLKLASSTNPVETRNDRDSASDPDRTREVDGSDERAVERLEDDRIDARLSDESQGGSDRGERRVAQPVAGQHLGRNEDADRRVGEPDEQIQSAVRIDQESVERPVDPVGRDQEAAHGDAERSEVGGQENPRLDLKNRHWPGLRAVGALDRALAIGQVDSPAQRAKGRAWAQQHKALQAPAYRVTLKSRRDDLKTYNIGKGADGKERFLLPQEVGQMLPLLSRENARGFDVYITPIDASKHYILIDDMKGDALDRLTDEGYRPALVQESSADNKQAVIIIPKHQDKNEQSLANAIVRDMNERFGDPKLSGVVHGFRMAGFSNKKPGRGDVFTKVVAGVHAICEKTATALSELRVAYQKKLEELAAQKQAKIEADRLREEQGRRIDIAREWTGETVRDPALRWSNHRTPRDRYLTAMQWVINDVEAKGLPLDMSRVDLATARILLREHPSERLTAEKIKELMQEHSPALADRHTDPQDYLTRTMNRAQQDVAADRPKSEYKNREGSSQFDSAREAQRPRGG